VFSTGHHFGFHLPLPVTAMSLRVSILRGLPITAMPLASTTWWKQSITLESAAVAGDDFPTTLFAADGGQPHRLP